MALLRRPPTTSGGFGDGEPPDDDEAIVLRALLDPRAFAPLYEKYADAIYRYCYRRLGQPEAAEDSTGVIFRKAIENLASFHGGCFRAWLFRIAENTLTDAFRAQHPADPLDEVGEAGTLADPERDALEHFDLERLLWAIEQLPEEWRFVVRRRLEGYSGEEIARMLGGGRTPDWVRQNHLRALRRVREIVGGDGGPMGGSR